ncbi:DUF4282 domain-containing protein [Actinomadura sp. HBU206391]|uniref:DUF4282 domain-containing protein n=1 Tax=Actinomadura sp. HBU206391 TaxID=2731692 RepID=UPI00164FC968|nr:DUF4282 domain-containing protein [Actinomadura sp. HBU206391]MBC6457500.1 DUF4282 domain-containing protein [Actinomadura sp. HBU206391]
MATPYGPGQQAGWPQQPQQQHYQQPYRPPSGRRLDNDKGFFGALFDFSFDNFIAPKLVKFLYVLSLILTTVYAIALLIYALVSVASGDSAQTLVGLLFIVLSPVIWLIGLIVTRLYLELAIVMFKISDDIKDIRDNGGIR